MSYNNSPMVVFGFDLKKLINFNKFLLYFNSNKSNP